METTEPIKYPRGRPLKNEVRVKIVKEPKKIGRPRKSDEYRKEMRRLNNQKYYAKMKEAREMFNKNQ